MNQEASVFTHFLSAEALKLLAHIPSSFWWWAWVIVYIAGSVFTLWVLSLVKNVAGWTGVVIVLLVLAYGYGWGRGWLHVSVLPWQNPIPNFEEVLR